MSNAVNRRVILAARPDGEPKPSDFRVEEAAVPDPGAGEFLARTIHLSLDPYMRGRMNDGASYANPVPIDGVMEGGTVAKVEASNHPDYAAGDYVVGRAGWQEFAVSNGEGMRKVDPAIAPLSASLGVLGMPGMTAYTGLLNLGEPKAGETVCVAAASGVCSMISPAKTASNCWSANGSRSASNTPHCCSGTSPARVRTPTYSRSPATTEKGNVTSISEKSDRPDRQDQGLSRGGHRRGCGEMRLRRR